MFQLNFVHKIVLILISITLQPLNVWAEPFQSHSEPIQLKLAPPLQKILELKMDKISQLFLDSEIIKHVDKINLANKELSLTEISKKDDEWQKNETPEKIFEKVFNNSCSQKLSQYKKSHTEFSEIFITDTYGLIACLTNKTSDYYQADENWWLESFNKGKSQKLYGQIEYDESSKSKAISVYVPLTNPETHKTIGIGKAVIEISAIKQEL